MFSFIVVSAAFLVACSAFARAWIDHVHYKQRIKELYRRILDAERLLRLRGNLASEIAHEIKNPISAILCSAETLDLLLGADLAEEHRISLRYIKEYGDNLLQLVSDFLDVSMAESGHLKIRPEPIVVESSVRTVLGLLESHAIRKKIKLHHLCTDKEIKVHIDPKHFKQVIFNLVHNALRFTPESGEVQVVVKSDFPNPYVVVGINDNGVGIPEQELSKLFDLYHRYEGNQPKFGSGLGLGLSLCKSLVEAASGSIAVTSRVGVGTSFEVRLPLYQEDEPGGTAKDERSTLNPKGRPLLGQNFLVVDRDIGSRESVARLIEAWGGVVDKVSLAADAIDALTRNAYDAVMIDATLEDGYGYEVARMIREELGLTNTTIILGADSQHDEQRARGAGADRCISKPYNGKVLLTSLLKSGSYSSPH